MAGAGQNRPALLLLEAALVLLASSSTATAQQQQQNCSSAKFSAGRSFQRCASLPVLGASLYWTYHAANGTADVAFRAPPQSASGWVAWGINPESTGMAGISVFVASLSQGGNGGAVSVLMTYLESTSPSLTNNTLKIAVPAGAPAAEYAGGAYTIYATVALPGNRRVQNTVWQAGPLSGGEIQMHPLARANLESAQRLDFLSGGSQHAKPH